MRFLDTETCGLHGVCVLIQWADDDGEVKLWNVWNERAGDTIELIEEFCNHDICGFNLAFDWFHLYKLYTILINLPDYDWIPIDHVDEIAYIEERSRFTDLCLKPKSACDIMLHARKGPYQSLMERDPIVIRKVPAVLAGPLVKELERRVAFDDIYFARQKAKGGPRWKIFDIDGEPDFKNIKLRFSASGALKNLYRHAFKEEVKYYKDIEPDRRLYPDELGYAPYALAVTPQGSPWVRQSKQSILKSWPAVIKEHCLHWYYYEPARKYAGDDVLYTRRLYKEHFKSPPSGDRDSELAICVACCRWKGYAVDLDKIRILKEKAITKSESAPRAPKQVRIFIEEVMDDLEKISIRGSTKKVVLEEVAEWEDSPAAVRAKAVLDARQAKKELELYDKLLLAKRFHASFRITGTLSNRMAGGDDLNPQGIRQAPEIRKAFTLADTIEFLRMQYPDWTEEELTNAAMILCGGDFKSFEVSIAAKVFDDPDLNAELSKGKKIHAFFGMELFPGMTYEQVVATDGTSGSPYDKGKKGIFALFYGGEDYTLVKRLGIDSEVATKAFQGLNNRFKGIKRFGETIFNDFGALRQPNGIGTKISWTEPKDYVESFLGFRRYFTLENRVMKALFDLAQNPPKEWLSYDVRCVRRDRLQKVGGAVQSALYAAAFGIQGRNIRAAKNHTIQSPGAEITKATQVAIWTLQPVGVHSWIVQPMNIHDEIMNPTKPGFQNAARQKVDSTVAEYKKLIPLLAIDWVDNIPNWSEKKGVIEGEDKKQTTGPETVGVFEQSTNMGGSMVAI